MFLLIFVVNYFAKHLFFLVFLVKMEVYHILGVLAECYPEYMISYSDKLISVYINELKCQVYLANIEVA